MQALKSLLITALLLGGAFLAYDRYLAPEKDRIVFKPAPSPPVAPSVPAPAPEPAAPDENTPPAPKPEAPKSEASIPERSAASTPVAAPPPPQAAGSFVPPKIPTVEDLTENWMRIPPHAFPRQVKLLQDVTFKSGFGSTQTKAGTPASVLAAQRGSLTIAPNPASALRATVPIDATDLKVVLARVYDAWRVQRIADARRAWEQRDAAPAVATPDPSSLDSMGRPQRGPDGAYPLLLASMKAGVVTEITPRSITRWGDPEKTEVNGKSCWVVPVEFDAATAFGKFHTEAIARVVDGRVLGWFYKGSGEQVP
jgi:hypothetical protein